ncbi:glycosyltransferase family 2 protein [Arenimonas fontis]|uniref:Glycosyltransferase family 2 protein n=1 Tax=Arenimonas fontis TaxID=2608255 RepID=A0A5B2ZB93_9GAMM|nr:glycosyltransferase family 2 protein [Arenimonas fontis]KAA2285948.1 glycosyltransferase family 2 protein [Arenimonas fontis]
MAEAAYSPAVLIPVFDHADAIGSVVAALRPHGLPILLVDDGSGECCAAVLRELADSGDGQVGLLRLEHNQGKGGAVMAGFRELARRGHSHALQLDADGQHDCADLPRFIEEGRRFPQAVINGRPVYDRSVPRSRLYGRYLTHVWVWINTLSLDIADSMCGFRLYPLAPTLALMERVQLGRRMDFDTEVIVRLHWQGVAVRNLETRVTYPADGVSHFDLLRDNLRISAMHARLFFGMLARLPLLLARRRRRA